jgi:hypothetical protein
LFVILHYDSPAPDLGGCLQELDAMFELVDAQARSGAADDD